MPLSLPRAACETTSSTPKARSTSCSSRPRRGGSRTPPASAPGAPSPYFIDAVEDSDLLLIDRAVASAASREASPATPRPFGPACNGTPPRRISASSARLSASAEERYVEFLTTYPSIVQRVPQYDARVVPRHVARDAQPHPQEPVATLVRSTSDVVLRATRIRRGERVGIERAEPVVADTRNRS